MRPHRVQQHFWACKFPTMPIDYNVMQQLKPPVQPPSPPAPSRDRTKI